MRVMRFSVGMVAQLIGAAMLFLALWALSEHGAPWQLCVAAAGIWWLPTIGTQLVYEEDE